MARTFFGYFGCSETIKTMTERKMKGISSCMEMLMIGISRIVPVSSGFLPSGTIQRVVSVRTRGVVKADAKRNKKGTGTRLCGSLFHDNDDDVDTDMPSKCRRQ